MDAFKERKHFKILDRSFKITLFLQKHYTLNSLIIKCSAYFFNTLRKIYSDKKNSSGHLVVIDILRLGDTVFSIPALTEIYKHYKNYKISIICFNEAKDILKLKFNDHDIIPIQKKDFFLKRKIAKSLIRKKINSLNPEIIFDLTGQITSASMIYNSKAKAIIGTNIPYVKGLYDKFVEYRKTPHFFDIYFDVVRLEMPIDKTNVLTNFPHSFNGSSKILIHPFAIRKAKEWNLKKFINLAIALKNTYEVEIVSPKGFIDKDVVTQINKNGIFITETHDVKQLIEKIKECSLFICNDSGPIYIACLLGKATFTIYGPTNSDYSLISDETHKYIRNELKCSPTIHKACFTLEGIYCPSNECMESLSLDYVLSNIHNFISELGLKKINSND